MSTRIALVLLLGAVCLAPMIVCECGAHRKPRLVRNRSKITPAIPIA